MNRTITIVGASARAAAFSALRGGYIPQSADLFADADLRRVCDAIQIDPYPSGLAAALATRQPGGWMFTGALENHPALVDELAGIKPLLGNRGAVLRRVRKPRLVADALRRAKLSCPEVALDAALVPRDATWLRKATRSAGGAQVAVWDQQSPHDSDAAGHYFQRFVDGLACSAVYVAAGGRAALVGVTRQLIGAAWTGARGFRYCGSIGPLTLPAVASAELVRIGDVLASEFELVGLFGVDAVVNAQGVWPVEVNPRYTASVEVLEWATGMSAIESHVKACETGGLPEIPTAATNRQCGKAILFAEHKLRVSARCRLLDDQLPPPAWPTVADIPPPGALIERGWPIVTVLAEGRDESEVLDLLRARAAMIRSALAR